jgi:hypothetical protein
MMNLDLIQTKGKQEKRKRQKRKKKKEKGGTFTLLFGYLHCADFLKKSQLLTCNIVINTYKLFK